MRKAIVHLKKGDPVLRGVIERVGPCKIAYREPVFETLVRSIVYQQLSGKVAAVIYGRLEAAAGGGIVEPRHILKLSADQMRAIGLSRQKSSYIRDLAERTDAGLVDFDALPGLSDEEIIEHLTQVKGIGVWTAQMFLIFALQRPDVMPCIDLGIRSAVRKLYGMEELPSPAEVGTISAPWCPFRSFASWYLWRSLDAQAGI